MLSHKHFDLLEVQLIIADKKIYSINTVLNIDILAVIMVTKEFS